jgi:hypothetical protein
MATTISVRQTPTTYCPRLHSRERESGAVAATFGDSYEGPHTKRADRVALMPECSVQSETPRRLWLRHSEFGHLSPYFVTDPERMEVVLENPADELREPFLQLLAVVVGGNRDRNEREESARRGCHARDHSRVEEGVVPAVEWQCCEPRSPDEPESGGRRAASTSFFEHHGEDS